MLYDALRHQSFTLFSAILNSAFCSMLNLANMAGKEKYSTSKYRIFSSPEKGYGLKAEVYLEPGTQIFKENLIAYAVSNNQRGFRCSYCLGPPSFYDVDNQAALHKCSKCRFVSYCGVKCQKKDWPLHKQECRNICNAQPKRPPDLCLLAARLLNVLAIRQKRPLEESSSAGLLTLTIENLNSRIEKLLTTHELLASEKRKEMILSFTVVLQSFLDLEMLGRVAPFSNLLGFLYWLTCNCFNILDDDMNSVGIGIFEKACLINHSCIPNCVAIFEGSAVSIQSIKPIKNGEEITISYIESIIKRNDAQMELQERYLFKCKCAQCRLDSNNDRMLVGNCGNANCAGNMLVDDKSMKCIKCGYCGFNHDLYVKLKNAYEMLGQQLILFNKDKKTNKLEGLYSAATGSFALIPLDSVEMIKCFEALFDGFIDCQNWKMALKCGLSLLEGYENYYPCINPITGIHLFKLGKLELVLENLRSALNYLEQSIDILLVTHGKEHRLTVYLLDTILKLRNEILCSKNQ